MTRDECKKLIMVMCYTYPNYKPQDLSIAVDIWADMLSDYSYEVASAGLKAYILQDTSGFAPSVGQLVEKIHAQKKDAEPSPLEMWNLVYKAICNSSYDSVEEFEKLPPLVQKTIGSPDYLRNMATDGNFNESVAQSQFLKIYSAECKRAEENAKLPQNIKNLLGGVTSETTNYIGTSG